jgi:hypothetical protein
MAPRDGAAIVRRGVRMLLCRQGFRIGPWHEQAGEASIIGVTLAQAIQVLLQRVGKGWS